MVKIGTTKQADRIRRRKPPHIRIIKPERIKMQPRLPIQVLPLKPQVLLFDEVRFPQLFHGIAPRPLSRLPEGVPISLGQLLRQAIEVVVVIANFLQRPDAIDAGQGLVAFVFIEVKAGLAVLLLL